jgi:glucose-1-phosphate cytidylyltransferase
MQAVILCGGKGTRLAEETTVRPKPMVTIGGYPMLWHIMKTYSHGGVQNFTLATGYLGEIIKTFFLHYSALSSDFEVDVASGEVTTIGRPRREPWKVRLVDTGPESMTGGRLLRLQPYLNETFFFTYGDGVCDVDLKALLAFHKSHGKLVTITAVRPTARFGGLDITEKGAISSFREKMSADESYINGGFMVMEPGVFRYLTDDETILERTPMERLASEGQLMAFRHDGFWQCMDTIRDRELLEHLWASGKAPWRRWKD